MVKLNVANVPTGQQKTFDIDDEHKIVPFIEKRMGQELPADCLGAEWKGYVLRITGGNDKQGFPMKQGVLENRRVRLLFKDGMSCYRERRGGCRKRKSVRGCIVGHDLAIINFTISKEGDAPIEGLTDGTAVKRLGPKRASKIRAMFDLKDENDDVRQYVVRREVKAADGNKKAVTKAPKIQRLVTDTRISKKRTLKKKIVAKAAANRMQAKAYHDRVVEHRHQMKEASRAALAKKKKKMEA